MLSVVYFFSQIDPTDLTALILDLQDTNHIAGKGVNLNLFDEMSVRVREEERKIFKAYAAEKEQREKEEEAAAKASHKRRWGS